MNKNNFDFSNRRKLLNAVTGSIATSIALQHRWSEPIVSSVLLPAHAQTSVGNDCESVQAMRDEFGDLPNETDLSGLDLRNCELIDLECNECDFTNTNLSGANLSNSDISNSVFNGADFSNTNLFEVDMSGDLTSATNANFSNANMFNVDFSGVASRVNANFKGANLSESDLTNGNYLNADFRSANLTNADLGRANLQGSRGPGNNTQSSADFTPAAETTCTDGTTAADNGDTCVGTGKGW